MTIESDSKVSLLDSLAERGIKLGEELGASQIEINIQSGFTRSVEIKNNSTSGAQQQSRGGIGVRAYFGKKLGIASATLLDMKSLEETVASAVKLAKLAPDDDDFNSLPFTDKKVDKINGLFDPFLKELDPLEFLDYANSMIQGVVDTHEKAIAGGKFDNYFQEGFVRNSLGINQYSKSTALVAYASVAVPMDPSNVGSGFEFHGATKWDKNYDFYELGKKAGNKSIQMLDAKVANTAELPVLFNARATRGSIGAIIGTGVNGFSVMNKTSYFSDKIGSDIAVTELNVWDDPLVEAGLGSREFDAEGYPSMRINLLENGVLKSYVTDSYTAFKLGVDNTGSANRFGISGKPKPGIAQLQIGAGDASEAQLLEDMKEGIFIESAVNPNAGSPEISSQINRGFYVKDGEIQYPVKNTMIASNVFDFLKNISAISKELLFEMGKQSPAILVDKMTISGEKRA